MGAPNGAARVGCGAGVAAFPGAGPETSEEPEGWQEYAEEVSLSDRLAGSESGSDAEPSVWVYTLCTWWEIICRSKLARSREMRRLVRSREKRR